MSSFTANSKYYKLHKDSADSAFSQLDLFGVPYTQNSILSGDYIEHRPIRASAEGPLEFEIETGDEHYLDLNTILLNVRCKVVKADDGDIADALDDLKAWPVNNFLDSTISSVSVSLNGHEIEYESFYPQRAYLEKMVNSSTNAKNVTLFSSLYMDGAAATADTSDIDGGLTADINQRKALILGSRTFDMIGRIHVSFNNQGRLLGPNNKYRIKMLRTSPEYCLMTTDGDDTTRYKVIYLSSELMARTLVVNPAIVNVHNSTLAKKTAKYPINRVESLTFSITAGKLGEKIQLFSHRQLPKRVFVTFIDQEAKYGSYKYNPNKLQHFNIEKIGLELDGHPFPKKPLQTDFGNGLTAWAWINFLEAAGMFHENEENGITKDKYEKGYTVFGFDLTGDRCEGEGVHLIKQTTTVLDVSFRQALAKTVCVYVYAELDDMIEVDRSRTVTRTSTL